MIDWLAGLCTDNRGENFNELVPPRRLYTLITLGSTPGNRCTMRKAANNLAQVLVWILNVVKGDNV